MASAVSGAPGHSKWSQQPISILNHHKTKEEREMLQLPVSLTGGRDKAQMHEVARTARGN